MASFMRNTKIDFVDEKRSSIRYCRGLPIYELRNQLEAAIGHIKEYNPLTFVPRTMNEYDYIFHNSVLCALSSYLLAKWSGLQQKDWMQAAFAGLFHDIGNAKIDPAILYKPSPLTVAEAEEMRRHTAYGYQILKTSKPSTKASGLRRFSITKKSMERGIRYGLRAAKSMSTQKSWGSRIFSMP